MTTLQPGSPRTRRRIVGVVAVGVALLVAASITAHATPTYPSDFAPPKLVGVLSGYSSYWAADTGNTLHGTVTNPAVLQRDDELAVWINQNATEAEKVLALQDSVYQNATGTAYDQSLTISTGLGSVLGAAYVTGRTTGALPLTTALVNNSDGSAGSYISTGEAKAKFSHPRPYLSATAHTNPVKGDAADCAPAAANASSQTAIRVGRSYANEKGTLTITRVAPMTDRSHQFSPNDVPLDAGYGVAGICLGGSFPSGHTTAAYEAGITLATLLPELAPEILARASENGNNRIVLGVHYPLDIMGGRISGEAALAARWSDPRFRTEVLEPARAELIAYLSHATGRSLEANIQRQKPYRSDPYAGARMPGGSDQVVVDRSTAVDVYTERMTYGFAQSGAAGLDSSVPTGASNLLLTTFPSLTAAQRTSVLAQTGIASGYPLDQTSSGAGSWQRLNLAAAMSASVEITAGGEATVISTGGTARVLRFWA